MSKPTLEERVAMLEKQMANLLASGMNGKKDWRRTVGMFSGDEIMKQIDEAARKYREDDRKRFYREYDRKYGKKQPAKK
jgi:hypothetical protein